jgi:hypothetical protein
MAAQMNFANHVVREAVDIVVWVDLAIGRTDEDVVHIQQETASGAPDYLC